MVSNCDYGMAICAKEANAYNRFALPPLRDTLVSFDSPPCAGQLP